MAVGSTSQLFYFCPISLFRPLPLPSPGPSARWPWRLRPRCRSRRSKARLVRGQGSPAGLARTAAIFCSSLLRALAAVAPPPARAAPPPLLLALPAAPPPCTVGDASRGPSCSCGTGEEGGSGGGGRRGRGCGVGGVGISPASPPSRYLAGERREERGRRKESERGERMADKWAPLPCGVHVSETGHKNSLMVKNIWFS